MKVAPAIFLFLGLQAFLAGDAEGVVIRDTVRFTPIGKNWQRVYIHRFKLDPRKILKETFWGETEGEGGKPKDVVSMTNDGNSFFRAITFCITGDQRSHDVMRKEIAHYEKVHMQLDSDYVKNVRKEGTDATEVELVAAASLLDTPIIVYSLHGDQYKWKLYLPRDKPSMLDTWNLTPCIFLENKPGGSYDIVKSVM